MVKIKFFLLSYFLNIFSNYLSTSSLKVKQFDIEFSKNSEVKKFKNKYQKDSDLSLLTKQPGYQNTPLGILRLALLVKGINYLDSCNLKTLELEFQKAFRKKFALTVRQMSLQAENYGCLKNKELKFLCKLSSRLMNYE